jgi:hypothetical protein
MVAAIAGTLGMLLAFSSMLLSWYLMTPVQKKPAAKKSPH